MTDKIEIFVDGLKFLESDDSMQAKAEIYQWFMRTPFWEQTSMFFNFYKDFKENKMYQDRNKIKTTSNEKNLFFMEENNPYICLRCRRPSEIVGFCGLCYDGIYGLNDIEEVLVPLEDIKCNDRFIKVVTADPIYTKKILESIKKEGLRNPIVLDTNNRILIGHHRYYIAKELGWETIRCKYNTIKFNHGLFYEGKGSNVFVIKIDGKLYMSTTEVNDVIPFVNEFNLKNLGRTMELECFLNVGSDIRLRYIFIPERGDVVDPTWHAWYIRKFNKKPKIGKFS